MTSAGVQANLNEDRKGAFGRLPPLPDGPFITGDSISIVAQLDRDSTHRYICQHF